MVNYAILKTGGKQYRVEPGNTIRVESLTAEVGSNLELTEILMVAQDGEVILGTPSVEGAKIVAEVAGHGRGKKIIVFKYKPKVRYRKKTGHRQAYTELTIKDILIEKTRTTRSRAKPKEDGAEEIEAKPRARSRAKLTEEKPQVVEKKPTARSRAKLTEEEPQVVEKKPTARSRAKLTEEEPQVVAKKPTARGRAKLTEEEPQPVEKKPRARRRARSE